PPGRRPRVATGGRAGGGRWGGSAPPPPGIIGSATTPPPARSTPSGASAPIRSTRSMSAPPAVRTITPTGSRRTSPAGEAVKTAIVNLGTIVSGDWRQPFAAGDTVVMEHGAITSVGTASAAAGSGCGVVID